MKKVALYGLAAFVFTIPWESAVVVPGLGSVSRVTGTASMAIAALAVLADRRLRRWTAGHLLMVLFVCWMVVTLAWTPDAGNGVKLVRTCVQLVVMVLVIWECAPEEGAQRLLLQAYVAGGYVSAVATWLDFRAGLAVLADRYAGAGFDPNDLGVTLALGIPMAWYLASPAGLDWRHPFRRWLNIVYIPVAVTGVLLTASRSAFLALLPALLVPAFLESRKRGRLAHVLLTALVVAMAAVYVVPPSSWERVATIENELHGGTLTHRTEIWRGALVLFTRHPVGGTGVGGFETAVQPLIGTRYVAHNAFLGVLSELGLVGLALFSGLLATILAAVWRLPDRSYRSLWLTLFAPWVVGAMALSSQYRKPTWLLFGLALAAGWSARYRLELALAAEASPGGPEPVGAWGGDPHDVPAEGRGDPCP
jgi:O-antigen ligase